MDFFIAIFLYPMITLIENMNVFILQKNQSLQ